MTGAWWHDHSRVCEMSRWLIDRGLLKDTTDVVCFFEAPWHWTAEHDELCGEEMDEATGRLHAV